MSTFVKARSDKNGAAATRHAHHSERLRQLRGYLPEVVFLGISALLWQQAGTFRQTPPGELGPDFWPRALVILLGVCALVRIGQKTKDRLKARDEGSVTAASTAQATVATESTAPPEEADATTLHVAEEEHESDFRKLLIAIALAVGYVLGAIYLGYPLATALFMTSFLYLAGRRNLMINAALGVGAGLAFSYVFLELVYIAVPSGVGIFDTFTVWLYRLIGIY